MTHEQARELLLELAYGELAPEAADEVTRHAAECAACGHELQRITSTRALASTLRDATPPRSGRGPLVEAARRAVATRPERRWFVRPAALSVGAAAAVAVVAFGVTFQLTRPGAHRRGDEAIEAAPRTLEPPSDLAAAPPASTPPPETRAPGPERAAPAPAGPALAAPSPSPRAQAPRTPAPPPRAAVTEEPRPTAEPRPSSEREPLAAPSAPLAPGGAAATDLGQPAPARPPARSAAKGRAMADTAAPDVVAEVERRRAAGDLEEARRRLRCGDSVVERIALVTSDGRIVKLTERAEGSTAQAWYDDDGRLRASHETGDAAPALPRTAPALDALGTSCAW